jgi:hypothetical protein
MFIHTINNVFKTFRRCVFFVHFVAIGIKLMRKNFKNNFLPDVYKIF